jgi:hypothetical protein
MYDEFLHGCINRIDMKRTIFLVLMLTLIPPLIVWPGDTAKSAGAVSVSQSQSALTDSDADISSMINSKMSNITLKGNTITLNGGGAIVDGSKITIISAGIYNITGTLNNGQVIVNSKDKGTVFLVLNGVNISCYTNAPIYIIDAKKTVITLADGTKNYITDGDSYIFQDTAADEPDAAIFSADDLTINGNGSLTVNAKYNDGIQSKDDLKILSGIIAVNAANDGIKGKNSINVKDGKIKVEAGGDGMKSDNDEDLRKGNITIESGTIDITAGGDGIQANSLLAIKNGLITVSSGSDKVDKSRVNNRKHSDKNDNNTSDTRSSSDSPNGICAGIYITISGGTININSSKDAIHSNIGLTINNGKIILESGDDGIDSKSSLIINGGDLLLSCRGDGLHADSTLEINGGDINITKSYEGIESSVITINNGTIRLASGDDGINGTGWGRSGGNMLYVNGGYTVVNAWGDGIDINGSISMTGGVVIISGPTDSMNGALDYYGFEITGGFIVAAGSSGMAQSAGGYTPSTQNSVMLWFTSWQEAGTMLHIRAEDGKEILTISPLKAYSSVALCSPKLKEGLNYNVYTGGSSTGTVTDGLYSGGTYTPGALVSSFKISSIFTSASCSYSESSAQR